MRKFLIMLTTIKVVDTDEEVGVALDLLRETGMAVPDEVVDGELYTIAVSEDETTAVEVREVDVELVGHTTEVH